MSSITKCKTKYEPVSLMAPSQVIEFLFVLAVCLSLALWHLELRFSVNEQQREYINLQTLESNLRSEIKHELAAVEALKRPEVLYEYARSELGMVPCPREARETLVLPSETCELYAGVRSGQSGKAGRLGETEVDGWDRLLASSNKFGLVREAMALPTE